MYVQAEKHTLVPQKCSSTLYLHFNPTSESLMARQQEAEIEVCKYARVLRRWWCWLDRAAP